MGAPWRSRSLAPRLSHSVPTVAGPRRPPRLLRRLLQHRPRQTCLCRRDHHLTGVMLLREGYYKDAAHSNAVRDAHRDKLEIKSFFVQHILLFSSEIVCVLYMTLPHRVG